MANQLTPLGTLNKLRGAVSVVDLPGLNVIQGNLGADGISISFEGEASGYLPQMTGSVPSPNPYQVATVTIHLLKTQTLSSLWRAQMELDTSIGDVSVVTDAVTLPDYDLVNCTIRGVGELNFAGSTADYGIVIQGTYYINSNLFSA